MAVTNDMDRSRGAPYASGHMHRVSEIVDETGTEHSSTATKTAPSSATRLLEAERAPLGRRELMLILAFWSFMAVLTAANRLLDPRGLGFQVSAPGPIALAFVESYLWALLTPLIFWLSSHLTPARGHRFARMLLLVVAGFGIAIFVALVSELARSALLPPPPRRGPRGPGGFVWLRPWFLNYFIIYLGVLAAGLARVLSLRVRAEREQSVRVAGQLRAQLAEARLDALRMQLDPHFLFNTLHAISSLVERDPRGVRRMISRLSELLRHSIEGSNEQEIPLRQELELLGRYLEIMEVRFQGRLQVTTEVDPAALDALVPNLILQPIVENAIKHGVSSIAGVGHIALRGEVRGDQLVLRVENDGPPPASPTASSGGGAGVGVRNTRARLSHLYGEDQSFDLRAAAGDSGTVVEIRLPYHTRADLRAAALG